MLVVAASILAAVVVEAHMAVVVEAHIQMVDLVVLEDQARYVLYGLVHQDNSQVPALAHHK